MKPSLVSEDLMLGRFDALDMSSQLDDSTSEHCSRNHSKILEKKTYLLEPLLLRSWSILKKAISRVTDG